MSLSNAIRAGMHGAMQPVGSSTPLVVAATDIEISGLDLSSDGLYFVDFSLENDTAGQVDVSVYASPDVTAANYYNQAASADGVTDTTARANTARFDVMPASEVLAGYMFIRIDRKGRMRAQVHSTRGVGSASVMRSDVVVAVNAANVTKLVIRAGTASAFKAGSFAKAYKIGAPVTSGTAFPTSGLVDGQRYFRTDLGLDCFYKASISKWLTVQQYQRQWGGSNTSTGVIAFAAMEAGDIYVETLDGNHISTTNSGSAYWTYTLLAAQVGTYVTATLGSVNTSAHPAAQIQRFSAAINTVVSATTYARFDLNVSKTGAPSAGNYSLSITYRKIIT